MSNGDGPPPVFDGDDFPYWKIRMEAYLEAIDIGVYRAASQGFPKPKDPDNLVGDEANYEKWNAKAKNTIFRGLCKDVFNRVRNHKDAHALWSDICALHEGTKSEREERYHLVMRKLNSFEMLDKESANDMYSRLNILVEELNGLGLTQMSPSDVVRKILCVLPIEKYGHIVTVLHQGDLSTATPTQILGKINAHEMYMHITPQDGSSSSKKKEEKKDLAFKASHEKKSIAICESSSDDEDANIALMVRKTTKMLKKLNKSGVKFDSKKKKFFTSSKRKPISEMDCYNCGDLGHLAHQCPKPKKNKFKKKNKGKKDDSSDDEEEEKKKNKPYKKGGKKKEHHKSKDGKAYIVGDWLTDISSSESSGDEGDDEKVAAIGIGSSLPPPPPSPPSSSSSLFCLMAKNDKVQSDDDSSGSDSDEEFEAPTYDELVKLLNKYTKIIRKTRDKNDELEQQNESLLAKYELAHKASDELRDENKLVSSTLKELKTSLKELKEKHDKLEGIHNELNTRYNLLKEEYTKLKVNHDSLVVANDMLSHETHDATNHVVKIDIATSCDDLIVESIEQVSSCKGKQVVVADHYDDYVKIKNENEKLKKDLENLTTTNTIVIESEDGDNKLAIANEMLREEVKKLRKEKTHLTTGLQRFTRGQHLQSELLMNTVMKMDRSGIGYLAQQEKKVKAQHQHQQPKPKPKRCFECGKEGHFAHECDTPPPQPLPMHARPFAFNAHYMVRKDASGKVKVMFLGPPNKNRPKRIWVPKSLVEKVKGPNQMWVPKQQA